MRFRQFSTAGLVLFWLVILGCSDAKIDRMSSGGNLLSGELESWLVLEFKDYPTDGDPRDVVVRFHSEALNGTEAPNALAYVLAMDPNALCSPFGTQTEKETNGI